MICQSLSTGVPPSPPVSFNLCRLPELDSGLIKLLEIKMIHRRAESYNGANWPRLTCSNTHPGTRKPVLGDTYW